MRSIPALAVILLCSLWAQQAGSPVVIDGTEVLRVYTGAAPFTPEERAADIRSRIEKIGDTATRPEVTIKDLPSQKVTAVLAGSVYIMLVTNADAEAGGVPREELAARYSLAIQKALASYVWLIKCVGDPVFCAPNIGSGGNLGSFDRLVGGRRTILVGGGGRLFLRRLLRGLRQKNREGRIVGVFIAGARRSSGRRFAGAVGSRDHADGRSRQNSNPNVRSAAHMPWPAEDKARAGPEFCR